MYDFCRLVQYAYRSTCIAPKIIDTFEKAGLWSLDLSVLLSVSVHKSGSGVHKLLRVYELEALCNEKKRAARFRLLGAELTVTSAGFVDTSAGAELTSTVSIEQVRAKQRFDVERYFQLEQRSAQKAALQAERQRREAEKRKKVSMHPGFPFSVPSSIVGSRVLDFGILMCTHFR